MCYHVDVEVRVQFVGVGSLLLCGSQAFNQAQQQVRLPTNPSC